MEIMPAIDLLGGQCVRLVQGRYDRVIQYERDPVQVAADFMKAGAAWAHVIDLDGARDGRIANLPALERIAATGLKIEFGGGVRDEAELRAALAAGAQRVSVGTRALEDWAWFRPGTPPAPRAGGGAGPGGARRPGGGGTTDTRRTAIGLAEAVGDWPLAAIVYTDIGRDGMLLGPNVEAIRNLASVSTVPVVASGGVTDISDVHALLNIELAGIVIGRAIYEGDLDLSATPRLAQAASRH